MSCVRLAENRDASSICAIYAPIVRDTVISFETEVPDEDAFVGIDKLAIQDDTITDERVSISLLHVSKTQRHLA